MADIEKQNVQLDPNGPLPEIHLRISSLVESVYRLVLRTPKGHRLGQIGEKFKQGDLGDDPQRFPDDHVVNFTNGSLTAGRDLNGCILSAVFTFAAPSDNPTQDIDISVYLTQAGKYVPNGNAVFTGKFTDLGSQIIRFNLVA